MPGTDSLPRELAVMQTFDDPGARSRSRAHGHPGVVTPATAPRARAGGPATVDRSFPALGTEVAWSWPVAAPRVWRPGPRQIREYDVRLSRFRTDSELCSLNGARGGAQRRWATGAA